MIFEGWDTIPNKSNTFLQAFIGDSFITPLTKSFGRQLDGRNIRAGRTSYKMKEVKAPAWNPRARHQGPEPLKQTSMINSKMETDVAGPELTLMT